MIFNDPQDPENVDRDADAVLLTLLRIYDTLMAMYQLQSPDQAERLFKLHSDGGLGSPLPSFKPENIIPDYE